MIAGIDPGRWKIGVAFVEGKELLFSAIVPAERRAVLVSAFEAGEWGPLGEWRMEAPGKINRGRGA